MLLPQHCSRLNQNDVDCASAASSAEANRPAVIATAPRSSECFSYRPFALRAIVDPSGNRTSMQILWVFAPCLKTNGASMRTEARCRSCPIPSASTTRRRTASAGGAFAGAMRLNTMMIGKANPPWALHRLRHHCPLHLDSARNPRDFGSDRAIGEAKFACPADARHPCTSDPTCTVGHEGRADSVSCTSLRSDLKAARHAQ